MMRWLGRKATRRRVSRIQVLVALAGTAVVLACAGILLGEAFQPSDTADLSVAEVKRDSAGDGVRVTARVSNHANRTASDVTVSAAQGGHSVQVIIDYVPASGHREAVLTTNGDGPITLSIDSWTYP